MQLYILRRRLRIVDARYCHSAVFFFFSSRRRHTRFKCDWSSDVCSSDLELEDADGLIAEGGHRAKQGGFLVQGLAGPAQEGSRDDQRCAIRMLEDIGGGIGRGSCRGREEMSGGAVSFKKKKRNERVENRR